MSYRNILFSMLFLILLFITVENETMKDTSIFLFILSLLYLIYKTFISYRSQHSKIHLKRKKEDTFSGSSHNNILDESDDFIQFLKVNQNSNKQNQETYRVQNLLNEVYGLLEPLLEKNHIELLYDVDINVPIELVGDSLLIEKTLYALLSTLLQKTSNTTIVIEFIKDQTNNEIVIKILHIESTLKDVSLLDTTHTLLTQLNGRLNIKDNVYKIHLPFLQSPVYFESHYRLPKGIAGKQILLIEDNTIAAKTITKMLQYFKLSVTTEVSNVLSQLQNLSFYDIIILDAKLLTPVIIRHIEEIKTRKKLYIISLETLYGQRDRRFKPNPTVNKYLYKPLSTGMIFRLLYELYVVLNDTKTDTKEAKQTEVLFIEEVENITRESFKDFNHTHILVVEDNKINQKIIQSVLSKSEITVTIANNGQEAIDCLNVENNTIDIVLMDINMPIMDGYQATKKIRAMHQFDNLPIVIVSSLGFRNEIEQMYLAGANAHLTKPFKIGQLYATLDMFDTKKEESHSKMLSSDYTHDNNILDTTQGTSNAKNILAYRDRLRETLNIFKHSDEKIKEYIIKKDYSALKKYCLYTLRDAQYIGANDISQILNEIRILVDKHEDKLLQKYITLYQDVWIRTQRHIKLYLKNTDTD